MILTREGAVARLVVEDDGAAVGRGDEPATGSGLGMPRASFKTMAFFDRCSRGSRSDPDFAGRGGGIAALRDRQE